MKCYKCGNEVEEGREVCPVCEASVINPSPLASKMLSLFGDKMFLAMCVLLSVAAGIGVISGGGFSVTTILFTIFLWLLYSDAKKSVVEVSKMRVISGTLFAQFVLSIISVVCIAIGVVVIVVLATQGAQKQGDTGFTTLDGVIHIPQKGIISKRIKWEQFSGQGVIGGTPQTSNKTLPLPNAELLKYIDSLYHNSPERVVISPYDTIASHSLIIANTIVVETGTSITAQLLAKDTLIIEDSVILGYPSGIYLSGDNDDRYMEVGEWSIINGYAIVNGAGQGPGREVQFMQNKNSTVRGLVYVNGNAECRGTVNGTIMINNSVVSINEETYNHTLYDFTLLSNSDIAYPIWVESNNILKEIVCLD